jgi:uncharacterized phage-associated protein
VQQTQIANSWAARFLEFGQEAELPITNMKLQKLVTLAESASEYVRQAPAFVEDVQAWDHGPAVYPVYTRYKSFKNTAITEIERAGTMKLADEDELIANEVWGVAGRLTAGGLRKLTHEVGPWPVHYRLGVMSIRLPGDELGAAWPTYVALAQRLAQYREPAQTPVFGRGADGFRSESERARASELFRVGRPPARAGG